MTWAAKQNAGSAAGKLVLLMLANHANGHTGQCNPRHKLLAEVCEMSVDTLKNHLRKLEESGLIEIIPQYAEGVQLPNQYRLNMQGGGCEKQGDGGGEFHRGGGGKNPPPYNQEVNRETNHTARDACFERFWMAYPKKVGKDAAQRAWQKIKAPSDTLDAILHALTWQTRSEQWVRDGGQYIPNPATYLNQGRWKDERPAGIPERSSLFAGVL